MLVRNFPTNSRGNPKLIKIHNSDGLDAPKWPFRCARPGQDPPSPARPPTPVAKAHGRLSRSAASQPLGPRILLALTRYYSIILAGHVLFWLGRLGPPEPARYRLSAVSRSNPSKVCTPRMSVFQRYVRVWARFRGILLRACPQLAAWGPSSSLYLGAFCVEVVFGQVFDRLGRSTGGQTRPERAQRIDGDAASQGSTSSRVTVS